MKPLEYHIKLNLVGTLFKRKLFTEEAERKVVGSVWVDSTVT
jgi:hypothetical protein